MVSGMLTIAGFPSSGKSTRANQLLNYFQAKITASDLPNVARTKLILINDESLALEKSAYDDSRAEKPARATLFSTVVRSLAKDTIVIIDAMNYIKGSRYQMYCAARELSCRTCTVFVATPPPKCKEWNELKPENLRYKEATLENLITRFEEPSSAARWDSPLFTISCFDPSLEETGPEGTDNAEAERIWNALVAGDLKPPNLATVATPTSSTSYLTLLEQTTSVVITTLLERQALSPLAGPTTLTIPTSPPTKVTINLQNKTLSMPVCQRMKRQFTKLNQHTGREMGADSIATLFASYLEDSVR
ncbi:chromatin associated protein KTI12 [Meredithblackwellia eburnea MCA 4105]